MKFYIRLALLVLCILGVAVFRSEVRYFFAFFAGWFAMDVYREYPRAGLLVDKDD